VIVELGHFAVILALIASLIQASLSLMGAARGSVPLMQAGRNAALASFFLITLGFAALMRAHMTDDFSVLNVVMNGAVKKPMLYKIAGTWASHEGSMLLWVLILTGFGAAMAKLMPAMPLALRARALSVQGMIGSGFLAFILSASNPFARVSLPPMDGMDLNPLLQDPALAFHPPFLYFGYVGFSSAFALAAALLLTDDTDASWLRWLRPFALAAWASLTFGIAMGSWWAYYELGWGGFWFWDPVENVALLPWLAGTAFVHSLAAAQRGVLMRWTILLAILAFSLSLLGTFLVRSGVLTSVHTFALDPARGVFILALFALAVGGALALYAARAYALPPSPLFAPVSRETALLLNNLFLGTACATLLIGTLYPLLLDAFGGGVISAGAPYFNKTVLPILIPITVLMTIGPLLHWRESDLGAALGRLKGALLLALIAALVGFYFYGFASALGLLALTLGAFTIAGTCEDAKRNMKLVHLPRFLAHAGLGVSIIGMSGAAFSTQHTLLMKPRDAVEFEGYRLEFATLERINGPNYAADRGTFYVWHDNEFVGALAPEQRFYPAQGTMLTDVAIHTNLVRDLYLALGEAQEGSEARVVRFHVNPLMPWIWIGGAIMAAGGLFGAGLALSRKEKVSP